MSFKREVIALVVRVLAQETNLVRKPEGFEVLLTDLFGMESYDRKIARELEEETDRALDAVKRFNTNRKFKKITSKI